MIHHFTGIGEHSLALKEIAGALAWEKTATTEPERGGMLALTRKPSARW